MSACKLVLAVALAALLVRPTFAEPLEYGPTSSDPATGGTMVADALIARPIYAAATAFGAAVFLVTLPFSALGGNVEEAGEQLVAGPARGLFTRCLGCGRPVQDTTFERSIE
jgi:hypothetical protein